MTPDLLFLLATCVYLVLLAVVAYFTRATWRRLFGALAGGVAAAVLGVGVEVLCQTLKIWRYPDDERLHGPPLMYPALVLTFALLALVGWRVLRRFGWRGEAVFLVALTVVGTLRDYLHEQATGIIAFAPGVTTVLVDASCWVGLTALSQGVMWLVAGPAAADRLARQPRETAKPVATSNHGG
jgi:hypothetical protein